MNIFDVNVTELDIGTRAKTCLRNKGIETIGQLVTLSEGELLKTENFGRKSLREVIDSLEGLGLSLYMSPDKIARSNEFFEEVNTNRSNEELKRSKAQAATIKDMDWILVAKELAGAGFYDAACWVLRKRV